jgi:O-antigen/teichoic acid export membrane protein
MFLLRRRMVRLLTVVLFPALVLLAVLAPVLVPWLFGPDWEPAVLPTQILAGAGAATVVIDAVGSVLMASGRSRAMLGYGIAHFAFYVGAVLIAAGHGLAAVSAAAVTVHLAFVVVAYQVLLHKRPERTLKFLWDDTSAAVCGSLALAAAAVPAHLALAQAVGPLVHLVLVTFVGLYALALRLAFRSEWRDLLTLIRRILPARSVRVFARLMPLPAER